jgi:hypothetical protein
MVIISMPPEEQKKAIQYLIDTLPTETLEEVAREIKQNGPNWWIKHHHGFGMAVRNLLYKKNLKGVLFGLDDIWVELVEKTVNEKFG